MTNSSGQTAAAKCQRLDLVGTPAVPVVARAGSRQLTGADIVIAAVCFVAAWAVYAGFGLRLAQGIYFDYYNLAFDFDPPRTLQTLSLSPPDPQGFRHPLMLLLRPLAWPFLAVGLAPKAAAALVMVTFGAGTVSLCSLFLRVSGVERPEAAALTLLFAVTGTQVFTSIIVEAYGVAGFSIALIWLLAAARLDDPTRFRQLRYFAAVLAFGVTITNVAQSFLAEMLVWCRNRDFRAAIRNVIVFGLLFSVIAALLAIAVWHTQLLAAAHDPLPALKELYWMEPTQPREAGIGQLLLTYFGFSFISPEYTWVPLSNELPIMRDFRSYAFSPVGQIAMPLWLGFWVVGAVAAACHQRYRWMALGLFGAIIFNLILNSDFQFRASVYIYASHLHFPIFALGAGLAPWLGRTVKARWAYIAAVLVLAALIGADNLPLVADFTQDFDTTPTPLLR
jgi:hypothetical protein